MTAHEKAHDTSRTSGEAPDGITPAANGIEAGAGNGAGAANGIETGAGVSGPIPGPERSRRGILARALGGGTDPDPRFTLANERTFLAWIRTSLAMVAGGIAVEAFTSELFGPELRKTVAVLLLLLGLVTGGGSFFRWLNVERAMRRQEPLPAPLLAPILAVGGALVAAVLIVFVIGRSA
jgi:putative membrane protein